MIVLHALLERWATLEPARVEEIRVLAALAAEAAAEPQAESATLGGPGRVAAVIQGALQEAIEARLWEWELAKAGPMPYRATVTVRYSAWDSVHQAEARTAATALLTAYLAALETRAA